MPSMSAKEMQRDPMNLRHTVQHDGEIVALTFRGKPYGYVVPADRWHALADDNDQRAEQEAS